ncbi:MAG: D-alanyl-D-alanine carboxypeptidase [Phenylobacterium sp.]|uniref:D-alanyl-D-alanine carboxypeptidase n=1 Tax=Phenylobacterium sp. TaxID=1871053 RepID=UPI001A567DFC|nr:D-alanyl-D-alanine carboxypeptidase [Phenylobacterium sp.]MBL8556411.1 D-alanyl-D-alanine carboxypeptidase [Phenylobacterium sp.]
MIQHARRLLLSLGLAFAMAIGGVAPAAMAQVPYLQLIPQNSSKYASIVVDAKTGEVLYAKRADAPRYPASITKVMTLYLTFEALSAGRIGLDDRVVFSPHAAAQSPTKLGIRAGDSISVLEAIQAMCTLSANDASVAMAEKLGGTEQRFAALMTLRAQELGMTNTNFANANGLPNTRNLSTARDIAILSRAAMRDYPQYYRFFSQVSFNFRGRTITNHNHMLSNTPGVDGLKTGFTNASGFNIAISGVKDGRRLIVVVLGGPTRITRDRVAESLLLTGFDVIRRRGLGEDIKVAQNFFEPPQLAAATEPQMAQGDTGDSLSVRLASSPPPARASQIQIVEPRSVPKLSGKAKAQAGGRWTVQVGSFNSRSDAREQLSLVEKRFGRHVDDARAVAEKDGGKYRARFQGMTEEDARDACKALKAKKQPCVVMAPGRG